VAGKWLKFIKTLDNPNVEDDNVDLTSLAVDKPRDFKGFVRVFQNITNNLLGISLSHARCIININAVA
jgi:formate dehydrogenase maturation protein FdhE